MFEFFFAFLCVLELPGIGLGLPRRIWVRGLEKRKVLWENAGHGNARYENAGQGEEQ